MDFSRQISGNKSHRSKNRPKSVDFKENTGNWRDFSNPSKFGGILQKSEGVGSMAQVLSPLLQKYIICYTNIDFIFTGMDMTIIMSRFKNIFCIYLGEVGE